MAYSQVSTLTEKCLALDRAIRPTGDCSISPSDLIELIVSVAEDDEFKKDGGTGLTKAQVAYWLVRDAAQGDGEQWPTWNKLTGEEKSVWDRAIVRQCVRVVKREDTTLSSIAEVDDMSSSCSSLDTITSSLFAESKQSMIDDAKLSSVAEADNLGQSNKENAMLSLIAEFDNMSSSCSSLDTISSSLFTESKKSMIDHNTSQKSSRDTGAETSNPRPAKGNRKWSAVLAGVERASVPLHSSSTALHKTPVAVKVELKKQAYVSCSNIEYGSATSYSAQSHYQTESAIENMIHQTPTKPEEKSLEEFLRSRGSSERKRSQLPNTWVQAGNNGSPSHSRNEIAKEVARPEKGAATWSVLNGGALVVTKPKPESERYIYEGIVYVAGPGYYPEYSRGYAHVSSSKPSPNFSNWLDNSLYLQQANQRYVQNFGAENADTFGKMKNRKASRAVGTPAKEQSLSFDSNPNMGVIARSNDTFAFAFDTAFDTTTASSNSFHVPTSSSTTRKNSISSYVPTPSKNANTIMYAQGRFPFAKAGESRMFAQGLSSIAKEAEAGMFVQINQERGISTKATKMLTIDRIVPVIPLDFAQSAVMINHRKNTIPKVASITPRASVAQPATLNMLPQVKPASVAQSGCLSSNMVPQVKPVAIVQPESSSSKMLPPVRPATTLSLAAHTFNPNAAVFTISKRASADSIITNPGEQPNLPLNIEQCQPCRELNLICYGGYPCTFCAEDGKSAGQCRTTEMHRANVEYRTGRRRKNRGGTKFFWRGGSGAYSFWENGKCK